MYAWEPAFEKRIFFLRWSEMAQLIRVSFGYGVVQLIWSMAPFAVLLLTFSIYINKVIAYNSSNAWISYVNTNITTNESISEGLLTPEKIFVSVALFNLLRMPLTMLPWSISSLVMVN
ncbi:unnamed protein product [Protopolystoma xenopodis]|uniref:ABC transmembrane type-1 domain-containing protein n=1 Tax=Protopolystoma xenopodis TaxID=117903 RepID=A0A3S5B7U5_9PLAT|nr:unnamed protein product [Protopolystoma xenopodis]